MTTRGAPPPRDLAPPGAVRAAAPADDAHPLPLLPVLGAATRTQWATVLCLGVLIFCFNIPVLLEMSRRGGAPLGGGGLLALTAADYVFWVAAIAPIFAVLDRTPLHRGARIRHGAARAAAALATTVLYAVAMTATRDALAALHAADPRRTVAPIIAVLDLRISWTVFVDAGSLFILVGVTHAILQRMHRTQRTIRWAADLRVTAAHAQLQALALELQPHFLFNTLNGVAELLHEDPARAERMLVALSTMLRDTVETRRAPLIPLGVELEQLARYVALQQMRFGPRLRVEWEVDPAARGAEVPTMLLQPLVENAITHGLERRAGPGLLRITAARTGGGAGGDALRLEVCDDGVGLPAEGVRREGLGLGNTRERLAALFGDAASVVLAPGPACGAQVTITLPWRDAAARPAAPALDAAPAAAGVGA